MWTVPAPDRPAGLRAERVPDAVRALFAKTRMTIATIVQPSRAPEAIETTIDYLIPTSRINRRFWAPGREV